MHAMRRLLITAPALLVLALFGCGKPPQIGSDEEAHKAIDALFTAVTARDVTQLDRSEARLNDLHSQGKLPAAAHQAINGIVWKAREGKWESAAERLYEFIKGQETGPEHTPRPSKRGGKR
jgi:hypothetical protein